MNRRDFFKAAGLVTVGIAANSSVASVLKNVDTVRGDSTAKSLKFERAARPPVAAKRWAMVVDLRVCREHPDCNECIQACHRAHNVPDYPDSKDEVKWIWKEPFSHSFPDSYHSFVKDKVGHSNALLLCNHCDDPPCVQVCPTKATFKRERDGIVMMDWHRCIGCRYCIAACPYGSRSFNYREPKDFFAEEGIQPQSDFPMRTRGVVEKCTFCEDRLARGQWPLCVIACPYNALTFGDLDNPTDPVRSILAEEFTIRRKPGLGTQPEIYYIV